MAIFVFVLQAVMWNQLPDPGIWGFGFAEFSTEPYDPITFNLYTSFNKNITLLTWEDTYMIYFAESCLYGLWGVVVSIYAIMLFRKRCNAPLISTWTFLSSHAY